jgi:hypothetical protein
MSRQVSEIDEDADDGKTNEVDEPGGLTPRQELALQAVISHATLKEAALAAGVSETTLWRYKREPEFSRRLREARRDVVDHTLTQLQRASGDAVTVLRDLMMRENAPAAARISAARTFIDYSIRAAEQDELDGRLAELEQFILRKQEEDALDRGRRKAAGEGAKNED